MGQKELTLTWGQLDEGDIQSIIKALAKEKLLEFLSDAIQKHIDMTTRRKQVNFTSHLWFMGLHVT